MKAKIEAELDTIDLNDFDKLESLREDTTLIRDESGDDEEEELVLTFKEFKLDQTSTNAQQRYQIMNTNKVPTLLTFGPKARVYKYSLNLRPEQRKILRKIYDSIPADVIVKNNIPLRIHYDSYIIKGVWLDMNDSRQAQNDDLVQTNFQFFVINEKDTSSIEVNI